MEKKKRRRRKPKLPRSEDARRAHFRKAGAQQPSKAAQRKRARRTEKERERKAREVLVEPE